MVLIHTVFLSLSAQNEELKDSVKCLERELAKSKRGIVDNESSDVKFMPLYRIELYPVSVYT